MSETGGSYSEGNMPCSVLLESRVLGTRPQIIPILPLNTAQNDPWKGKAKSEKDACLNDEVNEIVISSIGDSLNDLEKILRQG